MVGKGETVIDKDLELEKEVSVFVGPSFNVIHFKDNFAKGIFYRLGLGFSERSYEVQKDGEKIVDRPEDIGTFKEYPRAESRLYMLREIGFGVVIEEAMIDDEPFFVIREGQYSTRKSAEKIASRIKARTGIKCMIIEL